METGDFDAILSDVLVIGGGGAGLTAAIRAKEAGADVTIASKSRVGYGNNTYISKAVIAAAIGKPDSHDHPEAHLRDAFMGGRFINDQRVLEVVTREAVSQIAFLEKCGVDFRKRRGELMVNHTPGHSFPRHVRSENQIGSEYTLALRKYAQRIGVRFAENVFVTRLFTCQDRFAGAAGITQEGKFIPFSAGCALLATGGFAQIYLKTNNAAGITGDGQALAFELGVPLKDVEFVQFYPTALGDLGARMLLYEALVFRAGAVLKNSAGDDIIVKHGLTDPLILTRDRLARAVMKEILDGLDVKGGLIMDLTRAQETELMPLRHLLPANWSPEQREFIVSPTTHFCMGGIVIDENGQTAVPGLFAAGEVCAGAHGANRLGGNALAEVFAMGSVVGRNAAIYAKEVRPPEFPEKEIRLERARIESMRSGRGPIPKNMRHALKDLMWYKAGILRKGKELEQALGQIEEFKSMVPGLRVQNIRELMKALEFKNMLTVAEMVCRAALLRKESRGAHYRMDYPDEDNENWIKNILIRKEDSGMHLEVVPVSFPLIAPEGEMNLE